MKNCFTALGDSLEVSQPLKQKVYQSTFIRGKTAEEWTATDITPGVRHSAFACRRDIQKSSGQDNPSTAVKAAQRRAFLDTLVPTACFYPAERQITKLTTATLHLRCVYTKPYKIPSQKEAGDPTSLILMSPIQTTAAHFLLLSTKSSSRHSFILILTQKCSSEVTLGHSCWGSVYTCRKQIGRHCLWE